MSTNIQMLEVAVGHLEPLLEEVVFVGGATIELWISDPLVPPVRATADVDVVVEISTQRDYYRFEKRVRSLGFNNAHESKVICRFRHPETDLLLDVMPTKASILGFENQWQAEGTSMRWRLNCLQVGRFERSLLTFYSRRSWRHLGVEESRTSTRAVTLRTSSG